MTYINFKTYKTPKELQDAIEEYFSRLEKNELANPAGLRLHLGLSRGSISNYKTQEGYKDYNALMEAAYELIEKDAWKDLQTGRGAFGNFFLARCRKYSEKTEVESINTHKIIMPTVKIGDEEVKFDVGDDA